jgi:hypothetical protein
LLPATACSVLQRLTAEWSGESAGGLLLEQADALFQIAEAVLHVAQGIKDRDVELPLGLDKHAGDGVDAAGHEPGDGSRDAAIARPREASADVRVLLGKE